MVLYIFPPNSRPIAEILKGQTNWRTDSRMDGRTGERMERRQYLSATIAAEGKNYKADTQRLTVTIVHKPSYQYRLFYN